MASASRVVTAGFLRGVGASISKKVPDCAECTLADLHLDETELDGATLHVQFKIGLATPFRWNEQQLELEDGTQVIAVWPPSKDGAEDVETRTAHLVIGEKE